MTKTEVLEGILAIVENFPTGDEETLTSQDNTTLTDVIAGYLDTVNPNHTYPPVPKA